jgi:hypothetical protein
MSGFDRALDEVIRSNRSTIARESRIMPRTPRPGVVLAVWLAVPLLASSLFGAEPAVVPSVAVPVEDTPEARLKRYFAAETRKIADRCLTGLTTKEAWLGEVPTRRAQLAEMLGLPYPLPEPAARSPLNAEVVGTFDHDFPEGAITVERLHYQSLPGLYVTANLYRPKTVAEGTKLPTILYVCGHGLVKEKGISYGNKTHYQHHGIWYARNGYVCLIIDTIQLGELEGLHHGTHRFGQWRWNSLGYTPAGVETWNGVRAIDYLATRPEVDMARIGVTGRSGGGAYSWYLAAFDERIAAAVPTAGITDLENHVVDGVVEGHCDCMYLVNTYQWDYADVAALVAPRPLLISNTDKDGIFPLEGVVRVHEKTRRVYRLLGADAQLGLQITEGGHNDTQELHIHAFRWFNRFLKGDEKSPVTIVAEKHFPPERLKVFETPPADERTTTWQEPPVGLRPRSEKPKTFVEAGERVESVRAGLRDKVVRAWPTEPETIPIVRQTSHEAEGIVLTRIEFLSQPDVRPTLWVAHRAGLAISDVKTLSLQLLNEGHAKVLSDVLQPIYPDVFVGPSAGPDSEAASKGADKWKAWKERLEKESLSLAWLAPRGVGPDAWPVSERKQTQIHRRFQLLGQTPDGMRAWDTVIGVRLLREQAGFAKAAVHLRGYGSTTTAILVAAALNPNLAQIDLDLPQLSLDRNGADFLNLARVADYPELVASVRQRKRIRLPSADANVAAEGPKRPDLEQFREWFLDDLAHSSFPEEFRHTVVKFDVVTSDAPQLALRVQYNGAAVRRGELAIYPQGPEADGVPWILPLDQEKAIARRVDGSLVALPVGPAKIAIRNAGGVPHKYALPDTTPLTQEFDANTKTIELSITD